MGTGDRRGRRKSSVSRKGLRCPDPPLGRSLSSSSDFMVVLATIKYLNGNFSSYALIVFWTDFGTLLSLVFGEEFVYFLATYNHFYPRILKPLLLTVLVICCVLRLFQCLLFRLLMCACEFFMFVVVYFPVAYV